MKISKIIFSIAITAGVLFSTAAMAQTRVIFTTRVIAPTPHHYHPQAPVCGGYCAPAPHYNYYRPSCGHPYRNNSCNNNNYYGPYNHGNRNGYGNGGHRNGNRQGQGRGNHYRHN